ncbi:molybdenum transport ATP-binding protein [Bordetella pertussis]|nr:molybdenum transport ATP-binding protein [Bordetella pertussis]
MVVHARDVSLALQQPREGSILNVLAVRVLDADGTPLLARITRYSRDRLALAPEMQAWAQIKAVSLLA